MRKSIIFLSIAAMLLFVGCSENKEETVDNSVYFRAERFYAPSGVVLGSNIELSGDSLLIKCFTEETYENEYGILDRKLLTISINTETGEQNVFSETEYPSKVFNVGDRQYEVEAKIGDSCYESVVINDYSNDKLIESYDAAEIFDFDISKLKIDLAGEGGFKLLTIGEHNGSMVFVSNLGVSCGGRIYSSRDELTEAMFSGENLIIISEKGSYSFDFELFEPVEMVFPENFVNDFKFTPITVEGYDIAAVISNGVYGFKYDQEGQLDYELILDFVGSDIAGNSIGDIVSVSPSEFWLVEYDYSVAYGDEDHMSIWKLTAIPEDEYVPKTELVLVCPVTSDQLIESAVVKFNRANDDYRIILDVTKKSENEDRDAFLTRLSAELISGKQDAVLLSTVSGLDISSFERQGMFTDLYGLMDNAGFDKKNLLDCQTESFVMRNTRTGKYYLPYISVYSRISTLVSEKKEFDGQVSLEYLLDIIDSGRIPYYSVSNTFRKSDIIYDMLYHELDSFINDGDLKFESELFKRIVESYRNMGELSGEPVFTKKSFSTIGNFSGIISLKKDFEDYNIAGFPGNKVVLEPFEYFGICESSEHKDVMFEFLMTLLDDKTQCSMEISRFPSITATSLESVIDDMDEYYAFSGRIMSSMDEPFTKENSDIWRYGDVLYFTLDDEMEREIYDLINGARAEENIKDDIIEIIYEEVSNQDHGVDDVCKYVQDRVSTFWNERN